MIDVTVDLQNRLLLLTASGTVDERQVLASHHRVMSLPDFDPAFPAFCDYARVSDLRLDGAALRRIAKDLALLAPRQRRAVVVRDTAMLAFGRLFEAYLEIAGAGQLTRAFLERNEALAWLKADPVEDVTRERRAG